MPASPRTTSGVRGRRAAASTLVLCLLAVVAAACAREDDEGWEPKIQVVEAMRIEPELLVDAATFSGQLDAEHSVHVKPEIEGVIESIEFRQGQRVEEGDVLFRLRSREQAARLREARANRELAKVRWDRAKKLVSADAQSQAAADLARAELEVAEARVEVANVELERTAIRAPFDGVVGLRLVDLGSRVEEDTDLVRVDSVERLQVTFAISDEGLPFARTGMEVSAWVRPYRGERFSGEVFFVSPTLDASNRRIWVKAWIDNRDGRLAPGLFANVDLVIRRIENALVVPESAVGIDRQGTHVWAVDDELRVSRLPVTVGLRERGVVEIVDGLPAGTRIVTAGIHKISEGKEVQISDTPVVGRARNTAAEGALIGEGT